MFCHLVESLQTDIHDELDKSDVRQAYSQDGRSKGYIVCSMRPGQVAPNWDVPFTVPDNVWEVFSEHKESFPCEASKRTVADCPWAIPWEQR